MSLPQRPSAKMKIIGMLKSHLEWKLMYLAAKLNIADILYQSPLYVTKDLTH